MGLPLLGAIFGLSFAFFSAFILRFAFRRSVGTGFMVLLVPGYVFYFAFSQFEHPKKPAIVALWLTSLGLATVLFALAGSLVRAGVAPAPL